VDNIFASLYGLFVRLQPCIATTKLVGLGQLMVGVALEVTVRIPNGGHILAWNMAGSNSAGTLGLDFQITEALGVHIINGLG